MLFIAISITGCASKQGVQSASAQQQSQNILMELEKGVTFYFDKNSVDIDPADTSSFSVLAQTLKSSPDLKLRLDGHSDSSGSNAVNRRVSLTRATNLKKTLVNSYGVDPNQIITKGWGSSQPIDTSKTLEAQANNRRVVATIDSTL